MDFRTKNTTKNSIWACLLACALPVALGAADTQWVKARLGSFEAASDGGRRAAIQGLSQFEQFRYALGSAMGKPDLLLDPPLAILVFRNAQELAIDGFSGVRMGRNRLTACIAEEGQLPPELVRELTTRLLDNNFSNMPPATEAALETFFSTVQSTAVHVTWGAPPPAAERTREWALLHMLITQPAYSGRAHIYLHNMAAGMDSNGALRSLSEDPVKFNAEVDRYFKAGVFNSVPAPNRPLNPERDLNTTMLTSDEGQLVHADLLAQGSATIYRALLKSGKHVAEANEGLAILAMRAGNDIDAANYMEAARREGTKNSVALTSYSAIEKDSAKAIQILHEALTADPKYAPAHWALGERVSEPGRRLAEWKQAVALAPRNYEWWAAYARLCVEQKQFAEAGHAWLAAAQAAPDQQHREEYLSARLQIEEQRLNDEDAVRRREAAAKTADLERLKAQARKELADLEARANSKPLSKEEAAKTVEWWEINGGTVTGTITRVDCAAKRLEVKDEKGKLWRFLIADRKQLDCGESKNRQTVDVTFQPAKDPKSGVAGEVTSIEFHK